MQFAVEKTANTTSETTVNPPMATIGIAGTMQVNERQPSDRQTSERFTILVLKSNQRYEVTKYQRDGDLLMFQDVQGRKGGVDVNDVDWLKTWEMTAQVRSVDMPQISRQMN
jgi:hypothetical protein